TGYNQVDRCQRKRHDIVGAIWPVASACSLYCLNDRAETQECTHARGERGLIDAEPVHHAFIQIRPHSTLRTSSLTAWYDGPPTFFAECERDRIDSEHCYG